MDTYWVDDKYMIVNDNSFYCLKCGSALSDRGYFCDNDCRRDYFAEIKKDLVYIKENN